jgi:hypothetical protein
VKQLRNGRGKVINAKCYKCGVSKGLDVASEFFHKDRTNNNGFCNQCIECRKEHDKNKVICKYKTSSPHQLLKDSLRSEAKRIFKGKYEKCATLECEVNAELHHLHYRDNSAVVPLCRQHHADAHSLVKIEKILFLSGKIDSLKKKLTTKDAEIETLEKKNAILMEALRSNNKRLNEYLKNSDCDTYIALTAGGDSSFHSENCRRCECIQELK